MIGKRLSHYRIDRRLGEGGMGVVFEAYDERLHRSVALKVLQGAGAPGSVAHGSIRREADALLRLNHPRIGTLFDFDTADGVDFIVMEFVPGETLEARLRSGRLSVPEALAISIQVAEALEEAHEQRVVHCDLKPANVMVTPKGQVKVLDFGLARLLRRAVDPGAGSSRSMTRSADHTIRGTYPYMAPEQLLGGHVDERTDIHALGVLLYEMLTGDRPFHGDTTHSLVDAILHVPPDPPARVVRGVPRRLEQIVLRCLAKEPARRFASAGELLSRLRSVAADPARLRAGWPHPSKLVLSAGTLGAVSLVGALLLTDAGGWRSRLAGLGEPPRIRSVAVLPLANLSSDPQKEYLADGLTDAIIARLSQSGSLDVISRTSAMRYKGSRARLRDIGRELGVDAVIEGAVLCVDDRVRITARLVRAANDRLVWSASEDRPLDDVMAMQSEVAGVIADGVLTRTSSSQSAAGAAPPGAPAGPAGAEAQEAFLKGSYYAGKGSEAMLRISLKFFQQAIELAPEHAAAHAGLGRSRVMLAASGSADAAALFEQGEASARRALELDPRSADAYLSLGLARFYGRWDWAGARTALERALSIQPGHAQTRYWYSVVLSSQGMHDQAIVEAHRAEALDPLSLSMRLNVGVRLYYARRFEEAVLQLQRTLELEPAASSARYWLGLALQRAGRPEEAVEEMRSLEGPEALGALGCLYAANGDRAHANQVLKDLTEIAAASGSWVSPLDMAALCAGLGQRDAAFGWLDRAVEARVPTVTALKVDPQWDGVRTDPRFKSLLKRMGVPS